MRFKASLGIMRALFTRGKIRTGMKVLIPGIGSGVATFLLQFAKAAGATVFVTSRSKEKCEKALELVLTKQLIAMRIGLKHLAAKSCD